MPDQIQQDVLLSVKADTGDAGASIDQLKTKLTDVSNTQLDRPFKSFKAEIREAVNQAKAMEDQFGRNSKQFTDAAKNVASLKDRFEEFNGSIKAFNPDNKLAAITNVAKGAATSLQGLAGGFTLISGNSEKATEQIAKLQALMALSGALDGIDNIKNGFKDLTALVKSGAIGVFESLTGFIKGNTVAAEANAVAQEGVAVATTEASLATKAFRTALLATGIGAVVVLIGLLIANWDKVTESLGFITKAQEDLNKTQEDYKKGATTAVQKVSEVKEAFDLAGKGVISKSEALKKYNDTLGDSLGKTDSLTKAEKNLTDKADAYIQITALKAQANALFAKSADATATALTAQNEDNTSFLAKTKAGLQQYIGNYYGAIQTLAKSQAEGVAEVTDKAKADSKILSSEADRLLVKAGELGKKFGVKSNLTDAKDDKSGTDKEKANLEALRKLIADSNLIELSENEKKLAALDAAFIKAKTKTQADIVLYGNARAILEDAIDEDIQKKHKERQDLILKQDADSRKAASEKLVKDSQDLYAKQEEALLQSLVNGEINQKQYTAKALQYSIDADKALLTSKELSAADRQRITKELLDNELKAQQATNALKVQDINDSAANEKIALENKFAAGLINEQTYNQSILDIDAQKNAALKQNAIDTGESIVLYNQATADANVQIAKLEKDRRKGIIEGIGQDLESLSELIGNQTVAGKAFAVASATINTYEAATAAYKSAFLPVPTVASPGLGIAFAASAILQGLSKVRSILAVNVPGKGSGGGSVPSAPASIGALTAPSVTASAANPIQTQDVRVTNQPGDTTVRAYIVDNDLQNNAQKRNFLNSVSSF